MPRHPGVAPAVAGMPEGVFSTVAHRIAALQGEVFPLHVGDTWMEPVEGARLQDLADAPAGLHRYGPPGGQPELVAAVAERRGVDRRRVLVTVGATGGLSSAAGALLAPGDEVLILAPFWPLIRGIVQAHGGVPVEVPFFRAPPGQELPTGSVEERLRPWLSARTVAVYVNTPNNPTGQVLDAEVLSGLAAFARAHGLWILADEVYEDFAWARPHLPVARFAPERTVSAYSFSKAYGMAGSRVGYLVGPEDPAVMAQVHKVHMHTAYSAPVGLQRSAERALRTGDAWVARARRAYQQAGRAAAAALGQPEPEGGTFLLVDVRRCLDAGGMQGLLEECLDHNLLVAPGGSCGRAYQDCVRVCTTSAPPEQVAEGVRRLAAILERRGGARHDLS
ncbi:pyridoxal phosphate-dependent aminotransferase [Myxococcota bacterium]|nr:pyridoxal phosphate-dependent aminotransferase [Myxococcota bacterium]